MKKLPLFVILLSLFGAVALAGFASNKPNTVQSSVVSERFWSGNMYDTYYSHCMTEFGRSEARLQPAAVHRAFCDCHIVEAEKWLRRSDMTFVIAAINGESNAELEARVLALPESEAKASEKRMRQYTASSARACVKAGRDAVSKLLDSE